MLKTFRCMYTSNVYTHKYKKFRCMYTLKYYKGVMIKGDTVAGNNCINWWHIQGDVHQMGVDCELGQQKVANSRKNWCRMIGYNR